MFDSLSSACSFCIVLIVSSMLFTHQIRFHAKNRQLDKSKLKCDYSKIITIKQGLVDWQVVFVVR